MQKKLTYDLPTRLFHWIFALLFSAAFFIAKSFDDESKVYPVHMLLGFMLVFSVILRIIWGIIGTKSARFSSFRLSPNELVNYFKDLLVNKTKIYFAHNPASSWAALLMFISTIGLGITGYLMVSNAGGKDFYEEIHELFANTFIVLVIFHISGVLFHSFRHKDGIALSMIHGKKSYSGSEEEIKNSRPIVAILFLALLLGALFFLNQNYNSSTGILNVFGNKLQLSEVEVETAEMDGEHDDDD